MKTQVKQVALGLWFFSLFSTSLAQNVTIDIATERGLMSRNISSKIVAIGSPYIDKNFQPVLITQHKDKVYSARYNACNGEMEVKINDKKIIALDNIADLEVLFTFSNKKYRTISYITKNENSKRGFLVVISENNNYTLLKEENVQFYEKVKAASSYHKDKPANFKRGNDNYYLKLSDKTIFIPLKKKDLLKVFPDKANELKSFIKKNKLNPKNEEELIKIIKYIYTLKTKKPMD